MTIKVTLIFSAFRYSWSEAHYLLSASNFVDSIADASLLASLRQNLLGANASLDTVRLSNYPANRLTFDVPRNDWPQNGLISTETGVEENSTDPPFSSSLVAMTTAGARRNLYLAGVPDVDVQWTAASPNGYLPSGPFNSYFNAYFGMLIGNSGFGSWGTRVDDSGFGTPVVGVTNGVGFGNDVGVLTAGNPGLTVGNPAKLFGFRTINPRVANLTGSYDVLQVLPPGSGSSNWTTILARTSGVEGTNFSVYGVISAKAFKVEPYNSYGLVRVTHRKRGASYGKPVGRSLVRR